MLTLAELCTIVSGRLFDGSQKQSADCIFNGVTTDSRKLRPGQLFVALCGERFDGHDFLQQAVDAGAAGALVSTLRPEFSLPQVVVADTLAALQHLASVWRQRCSTKIIAVTGSSGKTTVKEMLGRILNHAGPTLTTEGNLNNHIGVPLTLLRLRPGDAYAVVEMGMNHPGEIRLLTGLAHPQVALINNAQPAHLEGLGSVDKVAEAKGEIMEGLEQDGIAVLNADDGAFDLWQSKVPGQVRAFGFENALADVRGCWRRKGEIGELEIKAPEGQIEVDIALPGRHNGANALAASAGALALGIPLRTIARGLADMAPLPGRLEWRQGQGNARILDDSYNANPASLEAAVRVLAKGTGKKILVLGAMGELGPLAELYHQQAGQMARSLGIDQLLAVGDLPCQAARNFGPGGHCFAAMQELIEAVRAELDANTWVLVKGSRLAGMERVVAALSEED